MAGGGTRPAAESGSDLGVCRTYSVRRLGRYTAVAGGGSCSCMWVVLYSQCLGAVLYRRTSAGCVHSVGTETRRSLFSSYVLVGK